MTLEGILPSLDLNNLEEITKKDYYLAKYGEVYVYKNKVIPNKYITPMVKAWFRDEID